ncbi:MAG: alpha-ketoacid dehydrogenase subunit beta, partial [Firmicutes bacterium]|nr:alpha-ketoacid dehydrogenase subunit beta [Bacillota bacterium]
IPLGVADVKREGKDITIVATGAAVQKSLAAAEELAKEGIEAEVVDPRTLYPLDKETIFNSVRKTGRLMIVTEEHKRGAWSAELSSVVAEEVFEDLKAKIVRIGALNTPMPFVRVLEEYVLPQVTDIVAGAKSICK